MAKKKSLYYDGFSAMIDYSCKAAVLLQDILNHFNPNVLPDKRKEMHSIEHNSDSEKHHMMQHLAREFITPIEREDIIELTQAIDDITDNIEEVLMRIYMYHIQHICPEALQFSELVVKCCDHLKIVFSEFYNFRKNTHIHRNVVEVNTLEETGDQLYVTTVHQLYGEAAVPPEAKIGWVQTYDCLEACCDSCEHVANLVEGIIMKNT
ncbi:MAG TPA: DUF47 domain-containing protein [Ruminococcaceae bacterium]|jgi:hypothetical protein|nr:DUF47 family protein [Oscillospiraceae bacterium]HCA72144.1 DUF47 domain-containing protein [Oscillospiraceae bacterium]HCC01077.1 DUF47 domain-containing protein [Oscillospiraceae bacterium]